MKKAIELADTTFRAYKKKNDATVLHLSTHLIVYANAAFRAKIQDARPSLNFDEPARPSGLSAFLKEHPRCGLQLSDGKHYECDVSYSCYPETRSIQRPSGEHWVTTHPEYITDEKCVLFNFSIKMIFRDGNIFGNGNFRGVSIADMKLVFHINFPGRTPNEKIIIRRKLPIVRRGLGW